MVAAAPTSGSLISARLAGKAERDVMAVRRSPLDPRAGCYLLIRPADSDRRALAGLHGPVAIDELSRQSGLATAMVATVLLELELARRLERHDGGRVSGN